MHFSHTIRPQTENRLFLAFAWFIFLDFFSAEIVGTIKDKFGTSRASLVLVPFRRPLKEDKKEQLFLQLPHLYEEHRVECSTIFQLRMSRV